MCERIIGCIDHTIDNALLLLFIILFLIGSYTICDTYLVYDQAKDNSLKAYKPIIGETDEGWDMSALSEDVVAWLTIDGTNIDYPIMQGIDNNEYLNKSPYGEYSLGGSLFLDSRNASDFTDPYSLVYGHHMEHGAMFGALDEYLNADYLDNHRTGALTISDATYTYTIFACVDADASADQIFAPGAYTQEETLAYAKEHAAVWRETTGERLLALSTCKFPETTERIIVFGYLEQLEGGAIRDAM